MIRMNKRMQARAQEETDLLVGLSDPHGDLGLRALVAAARAGDGAVQVREHDILVLVERVRRRTPGSAGYNRNGHNGGLSTLDEALTDLEAMG